MIAIYFSFQSSACSDMIIRGHPLFILQHLAKNANSESELTLTSSWVPIRAMKTTFPSDQIVKRNTYRCSGTTYAISKFTLNTDSGDETHQVIDVPWEIILLMVVVGCFSFYVPLYIIIRWDYDCKFVSECSPRQYLEYEKWQESSFIEIFI